MTLVPPAHLWVPDYPFTSGPEVADLCELAGLTPDPQQRLVLDAVFATRAGLPAIFAVDVIAPRRNLKTGTAKECSLGWLYLDGVKRVIYTAHEWNPAIKQMFSDMKEIIGGSSWLSKRVRRIYEGNGEESIDFKSGQQMLFRTRTKSTGQGAETDKLIVDEGLEVADAHMSALMPLLATRPQRQILVLSSAGKAYSAWLRERRDRGRAGAVDSSLGNPRAAWFEWCMPDPAEACGAGAACDHGKRTPGCALDNPAMLALSNPALSTGRLTLEALADQRVELSPAGMGREFGGWWDLPSGTAGTSPINLAKWADTVDEDPANAPEAMNVFGIEVDLDRAWTAIAAAGLREDGRTQLELVDRLRGTGSALARAQELDERHGPAVFVIDGGGPAGNLIPSFEEAGLHVLTLSARDIAAAAAGLVDAVNNDMVRRGPDEVLDEAVEGARRRPLGDGGFAFGRKASDVDVTPLVAVSLAHHGLSEAGTGLAVFFPWADDDDDY